MSPKSSAGTGFGTNLANGAPPDLPTEPRSTEDVEAWRERMDGRREEARGHRDVIQAGHAAEAAVTVQPRPAQRSRAPMSSTEVAGAVTAYLAGDTIPTIAQGLDRTPKTIRTALTDVGVTLRDDRVGHSGSTPKAPAEDDPAVVDQVRYLYTNQGLNQADVAARVGLGVHGVQEIMARHEIPARPPAHTTNDTRPGKDGSVGLRDRMKAFDVTSAQVRTWARARGYDVGTVGTPRAALVEKYLVDQGHVDAPMVPVLAADPADQHPAPTPPDPEPAPIPFFPVAAPEPWPPLASSSGPVPVGVVLAELIAQATPGGRRRVEPGTVTAVPAVADPAPRVCRRCGCTTMLACPGGCWWVEADLCSACTPHEVPADLVDAVLGDPLAGVVTALADVVTATEQLLEAQRAVALMRVRALHRLASELLAVLDHPPTTTGVRP